jgi:CheY-like chemotaxis protein
MSQPSKQMVLLVDDEPKLIESVSLHLGRHYQLISANGGAAALELLSAHPDTSVIVSDMRMPGMDGATFLARARVSTPDAIRILLTGQTDVTSAIAAVNEGQIYRFLTKPCPPPELLKAIEAACTQHRLVTAEKVLLEQTLQGCIRALMDVLALVNPQLFGRAMRVKQLVCDMATRLSLPNPWQIEMAAMLSQLPYVTLPGETVERLQSGQQLSSAEQQMAERLPEVVEQLLGQIPRLEVVRAMLANAYRPFNPADYLQPQAEAQLASRGGQLIATAVNFEMLTASGMSPADALGVLRSRADRYDPGVVGMLDGQGQDSGERSRVIEVTVMGLLPGMVLADDMRTATDVLLMARSFAITPTFIERVRNFPAGTVAEPIRVVVGSR